MLHSLTLLVGLLAAGTTPSPDVGSTGTAGSAGSAGTDGSAGTTGSSGTAGTPGTVGTALPRPWQARPPAALQPGAIPVWLNLSGATGIELPGRSLSPIVIGALLTEVAGLNLSDQPIGADGAKAIAATTDLRKLQVLLLANAQLDETGIRALAYAEHLSALIVVDLSGNPGSTLGMSELAAAAWLPGIQTLDLRGTPAPTPEAARTLGERLEAIAVLHIDPDWPAPVLEALRAGLGARASALAPAPPTE